MSASERTQRVRSGILMWVLFSTPSVLGGWIDPDTASSDRIIYPYDTSRGDSEYHLVFSDEFNRDGRDFVDGHDPKWTAIHKDDYTNYALQFYNSKLARTSNGFLNISTVLEDIDYVVNDPSLSKPYTKRKNYQSAMIQGWNKFCFTGGIVEVKAQLPGKWDVAGLWPAMWLMGNLARATYVGSSNNVWPWSYDTCAPHLQSQQQFSACNKVNHFDLHGRQGRGAPEIDILEAMAGNETLLNTKVNRPYYSASYQVSPGIQDYRPNNAEPPDLAQWYHHGLTYGPESDQNIFFYGQYLAGVTQEKSYLSDAVSANRNLHETHFNELHTYRLEWAHDPFDPHEGHLAWYLDGELVYKISGKALNKTGATLPMEPMYLLFNTALSSTWGFPTPCPLGCDCACFDCRKEECSCGIPARMCELFPANFLIDSVRIYQNPSNADETIGCSTKTHPTTRYIQAHPQLYKQAHDKVPLKSIVHGGGDCEVDRDCGYFGDAPGEDTGGRCVAGPSSWWSTLFGGTLLSTTSLSTSSVAVEYIEALSNVMSSAYAAMLSYATQSPVSSSDIGTGSSTAKKSSKQCRCASLSRKSSAPTTSASEPQQQRQPEYTGPHCLAPYGYNEYNPETSDPADFENVHDWRVDGPGFFFMHSPTLVYLAIAVFLAGFYVVVHRYWVESRRKVERRRRYSLSQSTADEDNQPGLQMPTLIGGRSPSEGYVMIPDSEERSYIHVNPSASRNYQI